jgi:hypothetical protein
MPAVIIAIAAAFGCMVYAAYNFDRLVQLQYADHFHAWDEDGRPSGFFWKPKDAHWTSGLIAKERLSIVWLFATPMWARGCKDARHHLHDMRAAVVGWNLLIITTMFATGLIH